MDAARLAGLYDRNTRLVEPASLRKLEQGPELTREGVATVGFSLMELMVDRILIGEN
jgi:hypothetical protein